MTQKPTPEEKAKALKRDVNEAVEALSDLSIFAAVECLMDSSLVHSPSYDDEARIVRVAQRAQQKRLRDYDAALARIAKRET